MAFAGPEFLISSIATQNYSGATETLLSDGRVLVTWTADSDGSQPHTIRGRYLSADGTPLGSDFQIDIDGSGDPGGPTVTALADGKAFVAWHSAVGGDIGSVVRGTVVDAQGHALQGMVINSSTAIGPYMPTVTTLADGHVLLTYVSSDGVDPKYLGDIRGRILDSDGHLVVDDFTVNTSTWGTQYDAQAIALADGRAFVTWRSYDPSEGHYNVAGRFINPDGTAGAMDFRIQPGREIDQADATTAVSADGRILMAWTMQDPSGDTNIYARLINPDGSNGSQDSIVNRTFAGAQDSPAIATLPDGRAVIMWRATNPLTGESDLYGRLLADSAYPISSDFLINSNVGLSESLPRLLVLSNGEVLATWTSAGPGGDEIHGRVMVFNPLIDGTSANDQLVGTADNDIMHGLPGNDHLAGALGDDALYGDAGNDQLQGDAGRDFLYGGAGNDRLWGGAGNDMLDGGSGADVFAGGAGVDTVRYDTSGAGVHVDLTLATASGGDAEGDSFSSVEMVTGSRFDDTLIGNAAANTLSGSVGKDVLDGRDGDDVLDGGEGNDVLISGAGNDILRGGVGDDRLWGNAGDDILIGGAGADVLAGGAGNDTTDYTFSGQVNINLATGVVQWGDAEGDQLSSIENLIGGNALDLLTGDAGNNRLVGNGGDDRLDGGAGNDILEGGEGPDYLTGGLGADRLSGGAGADNFIFAAVADSTPLAADIITDFSSLDPDAADRIDLSAIDANINVAGQQGFSFVGAAAFSNIAGQLRYADHLLQGDIDGDGGADFQVQVNVASLKASDFIL